MRPKRLTTESPLAESSPADQRMVRPLYPSKDYAEYVADQKRKGLMRRHWKDLPKMWDEELKFRREFEDALNGAA